jgi:hypothetical protein
VITYVPVADDLNRTGGAGSGCAVAIVVQFAIALSMWPISSRGPDHERDTKGLGRRGPMRPVH